MTHTVRAIRDLVAAIETRSACRDEAPEARSRVGVGIPGMISPATGCQERQLDVAERTASRRRSPSDPRRPVRLANDANCFALSEATDGAAAGAAVVFGVIIGTGTGGGVVVNGRIVVGANAIGGEWGHNPLPAPGTTSPGPPCYCGRSGCIETFLSGPALARDLRRAPAAMRSTRPTSPARAERGDRRATACLDRYEDRFARAIASIINVLDPDVIVLGGGLRTSTRLYDRVPQLWGPHVFSVASTRGWSAPGTAMPAACAARRGVASRRAGKHVSATARRARSEPATIEP